jgi:hypothetical protein
LLADLHQFGVLGGADCRGARAAAEQGHLAERLPDTEFGL